MRHGERERERERAAASYVCPPGVLFRVDLDSE
jgi:hypothetical protein